MISASVTQQPSQPFIPRKNPSVANKAWTSDLMHVIAQVIEELPLEQKKAVFLTMFKGLTHREIAQRTRIPIATVKACIAAGTREIRAAISARTQNEECATGLQAA